jgi:hypothetical protein
MPPPRQLAASIVALAFATAPLPARGESALRLDPPTAFGVVPASTYDVQRRRVGDAHLAIERLTDGRVRMTSESGFTGGARTTLATLLEPVAEGGKLRPILQESSSTDLDGHGLGSLVIDHRAGVARCLDPTGAPRAEIPLPEGDRVANVTLSLLLPPLVKGETDRIDFQLFFCGLGTRFVSFTANLAPANGHPGHVVEVRYGPDFGMASLMAQTLVPKLSFWFDSSDPQRWMAHRLPLYGNGPEVFVVRDGVPTAWLGDE